MFKTIEEFKQFIEWAKDAGLSEAKIGEYSFTVSNYEQARKLVDEELNQSQTPDLKEVFDNPRAQYIKDNTPDSEDDDDILFHSST